MSKVTDPRDYIEHRCRDLATEVWNEALDRAVEQVHLSDSYRDATCRIEELKIESK